MKAITPAQRLEQKKKLLQAWKNKLGGKDNDTKLILEDIERRAFGNDKPSYFPGADAGHMFFTDGMRALHKHIKTRITSDLDNVTLTAEDL